MRPQAIMTTDTKPKQAVAAGASFTVGGMAKGSGMIHPNLATMLAVVTTDYPLEPGEAIEFLRPAVDGELQRDLGRRRVLDERRGDPARQRREIERTPASDLSFAACLRKVCSDLSQQIVADGEGVTVLAEIAVTGAVDDQQAKAIAQRIATSPLVKTALFGRDANWGRVLMAAGSAPYNGGYAEVDIDRVTLSYNGSVVLERGAPLGVEPDVSGATCEIRLDLGLGSGAASVPDQRPLLRLRPHQRGLPDMSRVVVKVGGAVASSVARQIHDLATQCCEVCVVHGAGPQISAEMTRLGLPVEFVGGRRVTSAAALEVVRASFAAVNAALCEAIGPRAVPLFGDEIGLVARHVPELGLVGDPLPCRPAAIEAALAAGLIPVVAPLAEGPLNVNADEMASALAIGLGAEKILFLTDVPGLMLEGSVVTAIEAGAAEGLLDAGELEGGIVPKLRAAVAAAKLGVQAEIGETAVIA